MSDMTSNQPYLLRAFYDWIADNGLTPYIVVDATKDGVDVPQEFVKDGQIVLNVSPTACTNFALDLEYLAFQARFGGTPRYLSMPCDAVIAIYARENGAGTVFVVESTEKSELESDVPQATQVEEQPATASKPKKPSLTLVK